MDEKDIGSKKKISKKQKILIISSIVAVLLAAGLCLFLVLRNNGKIGSAEESSAESAPMTETAMPSITSAPETTAPETEQPETETTAPETKTTAPETETAPSEIEPEITEEPEVTEEEPYLPEIEPTYINGVLVVNKSYPLPAWYNPGALTYETQAAFNELVWAGAQDGYNFYCLSGFRSYEYQQGLYAKYIAGHGSAAADRFSARPGYSEHQSGLALDVNSVDASFAYTDEAVWLAENCYKYGFIIRYPQGKEGQTGYIYEPWHIRYVGVALATEITNSGLCLEEYLGITSEYAD